MYDCKKQQLMRQYHFGLRNMHTLVAYLLTKQPIYILSCFVVVHFKQLLVHLAGLVGPDRDQKCILPSSISEHTTVADHHDSVPNGEDNERYCGGPRTRLHERTNNKFYGTK
jgi:hypothetical protein